jgi:hypothetical protein
MQQRIQHHHKNHSGVELQNLIVKQYLADRKGPRGGWGTVSSGSIRERLWSDCFKLSRFFISD